MTSYSAMAARGRAAAWEGRRKPMVRMARMRRVEPIAVAGSAHPWHPGTWEVLGECGHRLAAFYPSDWKVDFYKEAIAAGKRRRCEQCPDVEPKPVPADHCEYEIVTEFETRTCATRGRFVDERAQMGYRLLCKKHHDHLVREGYLDGPLPRA